MTDEESKRLDAVRDEVLKPKRHTIEIDCAPGSPRPGDLLPGILEGTGVTIDPENTFQRFFGWWGWYVPEDQVEAYQKAKPVIKARIEALYARGTIRAGSW